MSPLSMPTFQNKKENKNSKEKFNVPWPNQGCRSYRFRISVSKRKQGENTVLINGLVERISIID